MLETNSTQNIAAPSNPTSINLKYGASLRKADSLPMRRVAPENFIAKLLALLSLTVVAALGTTSSAYPSKVAFQILMGAAIAHATELVHQCIHRTAIGKGRWDNFLGQLLALPSGTSFYCYRWFHLWHHRYNGTELDKESFDYSYQMMGDASRSKRLLGFARHILMVGHYSSTLQRLLLAARGRLVASLRGSNTEMRLSAARQIQRDYQLMGGLLLLALLLSLLFRSYFIIPLWLVPMIIGWAPIHALIELPEHWRCDRPEANVFLNTRSIKASPLVRWYTNNNCNHVAHHFDMSVPLERLPSFEKTLAQSHHFRYYEDSYVSFYLRFFRFLWSGTNGTR